MSYRSCRNALAVLGIAASCLMSAANAAEVSAGKPAYLPLGEFTVNLPQKANTLGYVVVDVTLQMAPGAASGLKDIEPRLKETVVRRLITMADEGSLSPGRADPTVLKSLLLDSIIKVRPEGVLDVLITRLLFG